MSPYTPLYAKKPPSGGFFLCLLELKNQMCQQCNDRQGDECSFHIDDEQVFQGNRDLAAHNNAADFRHIDQLCHAGCRNYKACKFAFDRACDDAGKEHVRKADNYRLTGHMCLRQLQ